MMIKKFGTITTEDELYFNTIRTIHALCVEKVGMNKIQALLKLQLANGAAISFSHVNATGELGDGGVTDWLHYIYIEENGQRQRGQQRGPKGGPDQL